MSTEGCVGIFLFCLDLELFAKIKETLVSTPSLFTLLLITQDTERSCTLLWKLLSRKHVQNSAKNIKLQGSWSSSKFSIFQTKNLVSWE